MNKWAELLFGLILIVGAILLAWWSSMAWGSWNLIAAAKTVFLGGAVWGIIGLGALFLLLGITDLKN